MKVYDKFDDFYKRKKLYKAGKIICPYCGKTKMSFFLEDRELGKTYFLENKSGQRLCKTCYVDYLWDEKEKLDIS